MANDDVPGVDKINIFKIDEAPEPNTQNSAQWSDADAEAVTPKSYPVPESFGAFGQSSEAGELHDGRSRAMSIANHVGPITFSPSRRVALSPLQKARKKPQQEVEMRSSSPDNKKDVITSSGRVVRQINNIGGSPHIKPQSEGPITNKSPPTSKWEIVKTRMDAENHARTMLKHLAHEAAASRRERELEERQEEMMRRHQESQRTGGRDGRGFIRHTTDCNTIETQEQLNPKSRAIFDRSQVGSSFAVIEQDQWDDDDEEDVFDRMHDWLQYNFNKTPMGMWWDLSQTFLSFVSCGTYVFSTYWLDYNSTLPLWLIVLEATMAALFVIDYAFRVYLAKNHRCAWLCSSNSLIDLVAILPILGIIFPDIKVGFIRLLRGIRVLRILRADRMFTEVDSTTALRRQYILMAFTLVAFMFIAAGAIHLCDDITKGAAFKKPSPYRGSDATDPQPQLTFFDALYFVIITITTVGFGDISPLLVTSKLLVIVLIICLLIILPRETDKISKIVEKTSEYDQRFQALEDGEHVVICGQPTPLALQRFLSEFYHIDHGLQRTRVVIMMPDEPNQVLVDKVLTNPVFEDLVQYVKGSPLSDFDLRRVEMETASQCFIFSNNKSTNKQQTDMDTIMSCKGINIRAPRLEICTQLLLASSKGNRSWAGWAQEMCLEEVKHGFLAASALCPGFGTMLCNLIASSGDSEGGVEWKKDYCVGFGQEMYSLPFSDRFKGWTFKDISTELYVKYGICVFAISTSKSAMDPPLINPSEYVITGGENAVVIADCVEEAQLVSTYIPVGKIPGFSASKIPGKPADSKLNGYPVQSPDPFANQSPVPLRKTVNSPPSYSNFVDHWIILGNIEGILHLVLPLRASSERPVVVLHPHPGKGWEWDLLMSLPNVFYSRGSAMEVHDLKRAGAETAAVIVVLQDQTGAYAELYNRSVDSFAIFVTNAIDEFFSGARWVTEIVEESSLAKLECLPEDRTEMYGMWPRYVSGMVYLSSSLDGLLAQCFYNESLLGIVGKLVGGKNRSVEQRSRAQIKENDEIGQIPVPAVYVGCVYKELYQDLALNHGIIALGLYRDPEVYNPSPPLSVVLTNPDPNTPLYQSDRVFILRGHYDPKIHKTKEKEDKDETPCKRIVRMKDGSTRTMSDQEVTASEVDLLPLKEERHGTSMPRIREEPTPSEASDLYEEYNINRRNDLLSKEEAFDPPEVEDRYPTADLPGTPERPMAEQGEERNEAQSKSVVNSSSSVGKNARKGQSSIGVQPAPDAEEVTLDALEQSLYGDEGEDALPEDNNWAIPPLPPMMKPLPPVVSSPRGRGPIVEEYFDKELDAMMAPRADNPPNFPPVMLPPMVAIPPPTPGMGQPPGAGVL